MLWAEFHLCSNEHPATMVEKSFLNSAPIDKLTAVVVDPTMILNKEVHRETVGELIVYSAVRFATQGN